MYYICILLQNTVFIKDVTISGTVTERRNVNSSMLQRN